MKMYFVCEYQGREWWACDGILENGFSFGQHICSHPAFAPHDLYFQRSKRVSALKEIFGIDLETVESETIEIRTKADVPEWWGKLVSKEHQDSLKGEYKRYKALIEEE